ncbi:SLC13 family permease, partial [Escherichia coli]|uniref:SLC13 family permease n=1 Tax=Escherichia coli TaxID=562 RepID=UPI0034D69D3A
CAANIGSAATLIGNPQNMLIGSVLQLPFAGYLRAAALPVAVSLVLLWAWLAFGPGARRGAPELTRPVGVQLQADDAPPFDRWQT